MAYVPKKYEIAGVDLVGYRQADGSIIVGDKTTGTPLPDFPEELLVEGLVYTLEGVRKNRQECGIKDPNHPGYNLEWGVYV